MTSNWIFCPVCGNKTRDRLREDTVLINYPLYCPKCKQETLIKVENLQITVITEPDAKPQSRWIRKETYGFIGSFFNKFGSIAHQIKKTVLWWADLTRPNENLSSLWTRLRFGGIFMCWSRTTITLLIRSSGYI